MHRTNHGRRLIDGLRPARSAWAHSTSESYVYVRPEGTAVNGSMQMTIASLAKALDGGLDQTAGQQELEQRRADIEDLYRGCFGLSENGTALELDFTELRIIETKAGRFGAADYRVRARKPLPRTLSLSIDGLLQVDHHQVVVAIVRSDLGWGRFGYRHRDQYRLDRHHTSQELTLTAPTFFDHLSTTLQGVMRRGRSRPDGFEQG